MPLITILTDFGTADGYVGAMKGVLASRAPGARVEDVAHDIPPGDVNKASWVLSRYWRRYPAGTVHLVVVDPGVGTDRRALAGEADGRWFVAPDNGVLSRLLAKASQWRCVAVAEAGDLLGSVSRTFHGRDLFAPVAALLATGCTLESLGPPVTDPVRLSEPGLRKVGDWLEGEVVEVDHFGNLATNLPAQLAGLAGEVELAGRPIPFHGTYGDVRSGEALALGDSEGRLEIAVRDGSATSLLGKGLGASVRFRSPT